MLRKPSIIGTGLSGLVGSRVAELLGSRYDFTNFDLTTGVDITDSTALQKAMRNARGESMLHLAAFTDVDAAYDQKGEKDGPCYRVNVLGTRKIAQECAQRGTYLVHVSTDFVFDGEKDQAYTEDDSPNPIEWYGQTKLWAEEEVKKAGGRYVILRIAFPYRAHFDQKTDLIRTIIEKLERNSLHPMFADQLISPTFIDDIAKAIGIIINEKPSGVYHIVGSSSLSPYDLAKDVARTFGFKADLVNKGTLSEFLRTARRPYQRQLALSNIKAADELGIKMSTIKRGLGILKVQRRETHKSKMQISG